MQVHKNHNSVKNILVYGATVFKMLPDFDDAACHNAGIDPDDFFPTARKTNSNNKLAKKVCINCTAKVQCLEFALENKEIHGIWGGLTAYERDKLMGRRTHA
jgi:WhiB family redox-sensing transcriptional regulator